MSEKEDQGDPADVGDLTENSEYEDDFENDPEGLTDEEEKQNLGERENPGENEEDIEAQVPKAADSFEEDNQEMEGNLGQLSEADVEVKTIYASEKLLQSGADTEQEDHESDTERESSIQEHKVENEQEPNEIEDEEIKRYVLGKIEEANKELENQAPVDQNRERKLKFEDELVDLQAPPPEMAEVEMPPPDSKHPPDSALNAATDLGKQKTESAHVPMKSSTYSLTPKQKELRRQIELKNERLRREEEERKRELEEERRKENDIVFRAWLQKKKEQIQEEKRIRRAKQLEELSIKEGSRDPEEAYRLWLKKKHQQYVREKRIEFLRRQAEEVPYIPRAEECDRAFRDWLRRKREEKRAEELAAKERARQLRLEARRARRMRNMQYI